jgi:hypothetical protein
VQAPRSSASAASALAGRSACFMIYYAGAAMGSL